MSVYDPDGFKERVDHAARCISEGRINYSRRFDACFEMCDGDAVVVALYRRSLSNPKLAAGIWKALDKDNVMRKVERMRDIPTSGLIAEAARLRSLSASHNN